MADQLTQVKTDKIGIVGSGLIGQSWAMLFAAAGYDVCIYDIESKQVENALASILLQLQNLERENMLRGSLSVEQQHQHISGTHVLATVVKGAKYIQECVPEQMELKRSVFEQLDTLVDSDTCVLASSTSSMPISTFASHLQHKNQCIVVHPTNPPFYCPLTEVCPAPYTNPAITTMTKAILEEIGQVPVLLKKELKGFVLNRLQYQLMNECWRLVKDDVIGVNDLDKVVSDGIGMRYAFVGILETCHLNGQGFQDYCRRFGDMIYKTCENFGPALHMEGELAEKIHSELCDEVPLDKLAEKRKWRDTRLAALARQKAEREIKCTDS